jgi:tetratricopeptide (TPR) repeat protein
MLLRRFLAIALLALLFSFGAAAEEPTSFPPQARARFDQAQDLQKKGKLKEAIEGYDDAIRLGMKDYPRAHLYRARAQLALKEFDTAIARYTDFIEQFGLEKSCRY